MSSTLAIADPDEPAVDISRSGVGARPMAMGKTFTGLADDANAIFYNPAGMAYFKTPKALNINSQLMHDVFYSTYALAWPTEAGTFGFAHVNVGVDNIYIGEWRAGEPTVVDKATYAMNVSMLSYANSLSKQLSYGLNLKYFSNKFAGLGQAENGAEGSNIDIGLMYRADPRLQFGLLYQNAYAGQTLKWLGGEEEIIESYIRGGVAYKLDELWFFTKNNLVFDVEVPAVTKYRPLGYHAGFEGWITDVFALRLGMASQEISYQEQMMNAVEGTIGLGLNLWGVQFDYTYASGAIDLSDRRERFFLSLSYQIPNEDEWALDIQPEGLTDKKELDKAQQQVVIKDFPIKRPYGPEGEAIVLYKNIVEPRDILLGEDINMDYVYFENQGRLAKQKRLYPGENWLTYQKPGEDSVLKKVLVLLDYADVNRDTPGYDEIRALTMIGVLNGYRGNRGVFKPLETVDYKEMEAAVEQINRHVFDIPYHTAIADAEITRREAVLLLVNNFGGKLESYLNIFPEQVVKDVLAGMDGGRLTRWEMAKLLMKNHRVRERIDQIAQEYSLPNFQIYASIALSED
jgi:hypothetical protein